MTYEPNPLIVLYLVYNHVLYAMGGVGACVYGQGLYKAPRGVPQWTYV